MQTTVNVVCYKSKTLSNGEHPLMIRLCQGRKLKYISLGISINAKHWDDFSKQKIVYPNMTKFLPFYLDQESFVTNQKCFILVGKNLAFLIAFLNSSLFKYCFINDFPELQGGTRELSKIFFEKIPVIQIDSTINDNFALLINNIQDLNKKNIETKEIEMKIDTMIFDLYNLSIEDRAEIGFIEIQ